MALTAAQTQGLQDSYKKLRAQGLDQASATAKLKEQMVSAGVYDRAKSLYQAPANPTLAPERANPNEIKKSNGEQQAMIAPAPAPAPAPVSTGTPTAPGDVSATPRGSVARPADVTTTTTVEAPKPSAPVPAGGTDSTGQIVPQGMTSFDTSAGKNLSQLQQPAQPAQAPAPAAPAKPEAAKVTADRSQEILNNLQEGSKNAPQLFQDYNTFKGAYGYDQKPDAERAQLDAFWQSQNKRTADQLIDMAITRQDLTPYKGTPEFITAQRVGKAVLDYSKMTPAQLADRMGSMEADLLPGSKAYYVLSRSNPQLVAQAEKIKDDLRRSGLTQYDENGKVKVNRVNDAEIAVSDSITGNIDSKTVPTLAAALGTKEIQDARAKVTSTRTELDELYDTIESVEDDVRKELKGTGATESYIRALIAERTKPLMKQVNSLERRYANEAGSLKYLTDTATDSFKYQWELASEDRKMKREQALMDYKANLEKKGNATELVDLGTQKLLIDKATGKQVASFDVTKPLTDKFEFRTETDQFGNQTTAVYEKDTGNRVTGGTAGVSTTGADYGSAVSYMANAGYDTSPAVIKTLAGKTMEEIREMYPVRQGMTVTGKPQTESQILATGFAERIGRSNQGLASVEKYLASLNPAEFYTYSSRFTPNIVKPSDFQKYEQYAREFVTAQLRKESGAAISESEWENAKQQYFPQPGDSQEVIDQKRASRESAYKNMVTASGLKDFKLDTPSATVSGVKNKVGATQDNVQQLRTLVKTNPKDAGPKYNNLGGISFRSANGKEFPFNETLRKAGIPFEEGGVRGVGGKEGGTYVKFKTVGDGIDAYNLLWRTNKYQAMNVKNALDMWGTGSVGLSKETLGKKISEIDAKTLSKIKALQIAKESPAMFQYMKDNGLLKHL